MDNCGKEKNYFHTFFTKTLWVYLFAIFFISMYVIYFDKLDTQQRRISVPLLFFVLMIAILTIILPTR